MLIPKDGNWGTGGDGGRPHKGGHVLWSGKGANFVVIYQRIAGRVCPIAPVDERPRFKRSLVRSVIAGRKDTLNEGPESDGRIRWYQSTRDVGRCANPNPAKLVSVNCPIHNGVKMAVRTVGDLRDYPEYVKGIWAAKLRKGNFDGAKSDVCPNCPKSSQKFRPRNRPAGVGAKRPRKACRCGCFCPTWAPRQPASSP